MKIIIFVLVNLFVLTAFAAGGHGIHLDKADVNLSNYESLQSGARTFVNYCMGCHSAKYMRYNRLAKDLKLTEDEVKANFIFDDKKIGDLMTISMPAEYAEEVFGVIPPDLSLVSRSRGADWLYTYMRSFYIDESRPLGVNNVVFSNVGMPHVLWEYQGFKKPVYELHEDETGHKEEVLVGLEQATTGSLSEPEYDKMIRDLVNFLVYLGEPNRVQRQSLGIWVMVYLFILLAASYVLKREYWRDIH